MEISKIEQMQADIGRLKRDVEEIKYQIYELKELTKKFTANWVKLKNETNNKILKAGIKI